MSMNTYSSDSNTRKIEIDGRKIVYTWKHDGSKDYFTFSPSLYNLLLLDSLCPYRDRGRLKFTIHNSNGDDHKIYAYDIAMASYMGQAQEGTLLEDISQFIQYKQTNDYHIDHLDDHTNNNTVMNLSLMPKNINSSKRNIVDRISRYADLTCVYHHGKYRVQFTQQVPADVMAECINDVLNKTGLPSITSHSDKIVLSQRYLCDSSADLLSCLNCMAEQAIWYDGNKIVAEKRRKRGYWNEGTYDFYPVDVLKSMQLQERLTTLDEMNFQVWNNPNR